MKKILFLIFSLRLLYAVPNDQPLVIFGSSGYILYRAIDFAHDHGFRYVKILSYEFNAFDHKVVGSCPQGETRGRYFELKDEYSSIAFLCLDKPPTNDIYIIDVEKYRFLLNRE